MEKQMIISVSREFGSGGHVVAHMLAEKFGLPVYDKNLLREIAGIKDVDAGNLERYDEVPRNRLFSRKVRGHSNSPEENIANMQFDYLKRKAEEGESFVVIGRCAESVLSDYDGLISIFILGDREAKIARVMDREGLTRPEAELRIYSQDKKRKEYHNYYCSVKWGDSRNYDICINSSRLGLQGTAEILENYISKIIEQR